MSESSTIVCPKCGTRIDLDDIARHRYEEKLKADEVRLREEFAKKEEEIRKDLREKAMEWAEKKAAEKMKEKELETKDLVAQLEEFRKKQDEAVKNELELRKRARELEEAAKRAELENARKLDEERRKLEESLREEQKKREEESARKAQEEFSRKLEEKEKAMEILRKSLEEANRKALQGSQQIQGEVLENELKEILSRNFPTDAVEDVPPGIRGADLVQTVRDQYGRDLGVILWESKNTKAFGGDWIKKLKDDRVLAKADVCILVTSVLPPDGALRHFGLYEGVWVTEPEYFLPLAQALRDRLLALSEQGRSLVGREEKMELLYGYLSGPDFRAKIENVITAFRSMKEDLESEKRSMQRIWSKREKELERIIGNTAMLYGDMQGIMGANLQTIEYLELGAGDSSESVPDSDSEKG